MAICKYCGQDKKLCKAHIIPKGFYRKMCNDKKHPQFSRIKPNGNIFKISPIGIYDSNILCQECDNKLGRYDSYACTFWKNIDSIAKVEKIFDDFYISTISGNNYNYLKLKKFLFL